MVRQGRCTYSGGSAAAVDLEQIPGMTLQVDTEVGAGGLVVAAGHLVEHVTLRRQQGDAAVGGQQPGQGFGGGVINQPPRDWRHDEVGDLGGPGDGLGLAFLLLVDGSLAGGGLGVGGSLLSDAAQSGGLGDRREGGGGLLAFEVGHRSGQGGEHAALAGAGIHAHGHEQAQRLPPARPGFDLDRAGSHGGQHGEGEHAGEIRWGLGGGGDRGHVLPQPAGEHLDGERGDVARHPERDGGLPVVLAGDGGPGGVGQFAGQVREDGRVGVGVGQADTEVDHPSSPGGLGNQVGVVAGIGHGGHRLNEGVEEGAAAHIGQLAAVVQLPQHRHRVGGLAAIGQPQQGPPYRPVRRAVEVGLLEQAGDLGQQPPRGQDRPSTASSASTLCGG
jgi:hypothetical protein